MGAQTNTPKASARKSYQSPERVVVQEPCNTSIRPPYNAANMGDIQRHTVCRRRQFKQGYGSNASEQDHMRPFVHKRHIAKRRLGNGNQTHDCRGYDCNKRKRIISEHLLPVGGIKTGRFSFHINKVNIKERLAKTDERQIVSLSECRGHTDE